MLASSSSGKTACYLAKMEYVIKGQELDLMKEDMKGQQQDVEEQHWQEQEWKKLDIELKNTKKSTFLSEAETL